MEYSYKFENFGNFNFPVYSSTQCGAGCLVTPHFHKEVELIRIVDGAGCAYVNTKCLVCHRGDLLFIPAFCIHSFISASPQTQLQGIVFDFSLITSAVLPLDLPAKLNKDQISQFVIQPDSAVYPELEQAFSRGIRAYQENAMTFPLEMLSVLYEMTALLLRHYQPSEEATIRFRRIQPVIDYIYDHFQQAIAVSELSSLLNVCDDHLIRLFKAATNQTPASYILDVRLEKAMKLLVDTEYSVTEIASLCGFSDSCYMTRVFKARLHTTPLHYRKSRH